MISDLTYKLVASSEAILLKTNDCITWAIEMLELGYDTPNILILSSFTKSSSFFEIKPYVENAIEELGLKFKIGDAGIISYSYYFIRQISQNKNVRLNLYELYKFCQQRNYEGLIYDFYLLYWAWDQIDYDDTNNNHYWEGTNKNNIKQIVIRVANNWLIKNKEHYVQQCVTKT